MTFQQFLDLVQMHLDELGKPHGPVLMNLLEVYYPSLHARVADTFIDCTFAYSTTNDTFQQLLIWLERNW